MKYGQKRIMLLTACIAIVLTISSCIPQKQIVLVQDAIPEESTFQTPKEVTEQYVLKPNDYLFINVTTPNTDLSSFYNPQSAQKSQGSNLRQEFYYYGLDDSCCIDFPVTGRIDLKGCNLREAKQRIHEAISHTLNGFTLIVRLATNTFSIMGEVNHQGQFTMSRDQITIFDAVSMAGGFTSYAKRKEVKILRRDENGEVSVHVLDLTKGNFMESDYYYVYPNDVIYVRPLWFKMFGFGETLSLTLVSSLVTLYLLFLQL